MDLEYTVPVHTNNEHASNVPSHAEIILLPKGIKRILMLAQLCRKIKVYKISEFDYTPSYLTEKEEGVYKEWEGGIDYAILEVMKDGFKWVACTKHSDYEIETEEIDLKELQENMGVLRMKVSDLPLLIGKEFKYETTQKVLDKRMRGVSCREP